ncbi:phosphatase PAP2 family protein [Sphingomonas kaistensis]|uniref:Phosphatase PAP2 family protein n=1 Tax=Sphingomonas kaistensis TaxID=298708 RepID=A0ABZ2FX53_9SPHN
MMKPTNSDLLRKCARSPLTDLVSGPHRLDSKVLLSFLTVAVTLMALFWLGSEVLEGDIFAFDKTVLLSLRLAHDPATPIGPHWLPRIVLDITAIGGVTVLTLITVLVVGFLVVSRSGRTAAFVAAAVASGASASAALKSFFVRPRPEIVPHLIEAASTSFPSGHAMNSAMVYLTLATLIARTQERVAVRLYLVGAAIILTLMVGMTRVFLGVHWPSDVLAGWGIGALWAVLCSLTAKLFQRERKGG